jgi:hypothetical protein
LEGIGKGMKGERGEGRREGGRREERGGRREGGRSILIPLGKEYNVFFGHPNRCRGGRGKNVPGTKWQLIQTPRGLFSFLPKFFSTLKLRKKFCKPQRLIFFLNPLPCLNFYQLDIF